MPLNVNNVDASVCANFLFGLIFQINQKEVEVNDELAKMMVHISIFLEYTLKKIINERPDIILLYYPSKYDFYWFIARIVHLLKRNNDKVYPLP